MCGDDGPGVLADAFGGDGCEHREDGAVGVAELEWVDLALQRVSLLVEGADFGVARREEETPWRVRVGRVRGANKAMARARLRRRRGPEPGADAYLAPLRPDRRLTPCRWSLARHVRRAAKVLLGATSCASFEILAGRFPQPRRLNAARPCPSRPGRCLPSSI